MTSRIEKLKTDLAWAAVVTAAMLVGLIVAIINVINLTAQVNKYETLLEMSCETMYGKYQDRCSTTLELLKGMSTEDIKKLKY